MIKSYSITSSDASRISINDVILKQKFMTEIKWTPIKVLDILFELHKGVAKITINRPQVYNAFRPEQTIKCSKQWIFAMT